MTAAPASHAAFNHAQLEAAAGGAGLPAGGVEVDDLLLWVLLEALPLAREEAGGDHVLLDHAANRRKDRGHVLALDPGTAARVEHGLQLLDHEGHVAATPEHRRDHPGQRHGPGEMLHVLGVDEHLEGPSVAADDEVVDGDIDRVLAVGPFQLVGRALKFGGTVERL